MRLKKHLCLILAIINILVVSIGSYLYFNNQLSLRYLLFQVVIILTSIICSVCFCIQDKEVLKVFEKKIQHRIMINIYRILLLVFVALVFGYVMLYMDGEGTISEELIDLNVTLSYLILSVFQCYFGKSVYRASIVCEHLQHITTSKWFEKVPNEIPGIVKFLKYGQIPVWILIIIVFVVIITSHMMYITDPQLMLSFVSMLSSLFMILVPIVFVLFITSSAQMEPIKDDKYSNSKILMISLDIAVLMLGYHFVSYFGKTMIGTGIFTPNGSMMDPLKQFPAYYMNESMLYWGLMLLALHVYLLFSQKRYEYEKERIKQQ